MSGQDRLPHRVYAEAVVEELAGPYAPDEWSADPYTDDGVSLYFRRTRPDDSHPPAPGAERLQVVDDSQWPHGLLVVWTAAAGWQYGPLVGESADESAGEAFYYAPLPVHRLAAPASLRAVLPALFAGDVDQLPASSDAWDEPGSSEQLADHAARPQDASPASPKGMTEQEEAEFQDALAPRLADVPPDAPLSTLAVRWILASFRTMTLQIGNSPSPRTEQAVLAEVLTQLAVGEVIGRTVQQERAELIGAAVLVGGSWDQVEAALETTAPAAATELWQWADEQHARYCQDLARWPESEPRGLDHDRHAILMQLVNVAMHRAADGAQSAYEQMQAAVQDTPMVHTVGTLRSLLEQLPGSMPLSLDYHHRALPDEPDRVHTVHPSLAGAIFAEDTPTQATETGLMLTQVYVPDDGTEEEIAAVASACRDLPPLDGIARASHHLLRGDVGASLTDTAILLEDVVYLLGRAAEQQAQDDPEVADSLRIEAQRLDDAASRVRSLAPDDEEPF